MFSPPGKPFDRVTNPRWTIEVATRHHKNGMVTIVKNLDVLSQTSGIKLLGGGRCAVGWDFLSLLFRSLFLWFRWLASISFRVFTTNV